MAPHIHRQPAWVLLGGDPGRRCAASGMDGRGHLPRPARLTFLQPLSVTLSMVHEILGIRPPAETGCGAEVPRVHGWSERTAGCQKRDRQASRPRSANATPTGMDIEEREASERDRSSTGATALNPP
jgi:hypothetical protein